MADGLHILPRGLVLLAGTLSGGSFAGRRRANRGCAVESSPSVCYESCCRYRNLGDDAGGSQFIGGHLLVSLRPVLYHIIWMDRLRCIGARCALLRIVVRCTCPAGITLGKEAECSSGLGRACTRDMVQSFFLPWSRECGECREECSRTYRSQCTSHSACGEGSSLPHLSGRKNR